MGWTSVMAEREFSLKLGSEIGRNMEAIAWLSRTG